MPNDEADDPCSDAFVWLSVRGAGGGGQHLQLQHSGRLYNHGVAGVSGVVGPVVNPDAQGEQPRLEVLRDETGGQTSEKAGPQTGKDVGGGEFCFKPRRAAKSGDPFGG